MSEQSYSREYLQELAEQPINSSARASKLWLPKGRKKAAPLTEGERAANRANASMRRVLDKASISNKRAKLLEYYAGTDVPVERIAKHVGIPVNEAKAALAALRGAA